MKKSLLITLGHNSSAIYVDKANDLLIGYEQERLDGIKASSRFPMDAINEIIKNIGIDNMIGCNVYVSHWFNSNALPYGNKYISKNDYTFLEFISNGNVEFVNLDFTHHDAHAYSVAAFKRYYMTSSFIEIENEKPTHIIVADGFGTDKEVLSIYSHTSLENVKLIHRYSGYAGSLGLMYQYATSYCGMKENQDEYKFLGYEPMLFELLPSEKISQLRLLVHDNVSLLIDRLYGRNEKYKPSDPMKLIDYNDLKATKNHWVKIFDNVLERVGFGIEVTGTNEKRAIIAFFIQQTIEGVLYDMIKRFKMHNVAVTGGIFYNVKLNNHVLTNINGSFCAMPLAGDQGAAIGMYVKDFKHFDFKTLCIGKRNIDEIRKYSHKNMKVYDQPITEIARRKMMREITELIAAGNIVNLVHGDMEFGPRALCNTSTLFLPTKSNVAANNKMNKRNEVMPCAPVIRQDNISLFFDEAEMNRVVGSDRFMICTHDYKLPNGYSKLLSKAIVDTFIDYYGGVAHQKTGCEDIFTGRPQVVYNNDFIWEVLTNLHNDNTLPNNACLVNTSFNAHGRPIVFDVMDIVHNFRFQYDNADAENKPYLIVIL